jgi:NADPH:quinone reductase-like Zn-dependent oxidoreductase
MPNECIIAPKPVNLTFEESATLPTRGTLALYFLKKGNIQKNQKVLIYGASGAIGTIAVQLAKHFGTEVTGVCSTANLGLVKNLGADKVIDYTGNDYDKKLERYDLIFDAVGKSKSSQLKLLCKKLLTPNGKYISVDDGIPKIKLDDLQLIQKLADEGILKPVIDKCFSLEQTADAHRYVDEGHKKGNVVISIQNNGISI